MKPYLFFIALMVLLLAALACSLPWEQTQETPPPQIVIITATEPEPTVTTEMTEVEPTPEEPVQEPVEEPIEEPDDEPFSCSTDMVPATAFSVEFCYPNLYSNGPTQVMIPENPPTGDMPIWGINPDMIEITLAGYPVLNEYHSPVIRIYPVADFVALEPTIQTLVDDLQALLASGATNPSNIPFVPIFNAAQMMQAQVTHMAFRNGRGVRFITQYSQAAMPISNDSAFYAFIGLTDDNTYLISATLPVTHPLFYMDNMTEPPEGWAVFAENFEDYLDTMEADLSIQPHDSFFPVLTPLDEMMASFLIPIEAIP